MMPRFAKQALLLAAALLLSTPALFAQATNGLYRMMTGGPQPAAVVDLKFFSQVPRQVKVTATVLNPAGGFRLYFGTLERGGLNVIYATLREVEEPLPFLLAFDPSRPFREFVGYLGDESCQFFLYTGPSYYDFTCRSSSPASPPTGGRLERLPG